MDCRYLNLRYLSFIKWIRYLLVYRSWLEIKKQSTSLVVSARFSRAPTTIMRMLRSSTSCMIPATLRRLLYRIGFSFTSGKMKIITDCFSVEEAVVISHWSITSGLCLSKIETANGLDWVGVVLVDAPAILRDNRRSIGTIQAFNERINPMTRGGSQETMIFSCDAHIIPTTRRYDD